MLAQSLAGGSNFLRILEALIEAGMLAAGVAGFSRLMDRDEEVRWRSLKQPEEPFIDLGVASGTACW
jgi:hypothetical protein